MLELLDDALKALPRLLESPGEWESMVINRAKPVTCRAFTQWRGNRLCLHRFETCDPDETVPHPHPWPGAFAVIRGSYLMGVGRSLDRMAPPMQVLRILLGPGSRYEITDPLTWHSVAPREECFTVMVNGPDWPEGVAHSRVRRTRGKGLAPMQPTELAELFDFFRRALTAA